MQAISVEFMKNNVYLLANNYKVIIMLWFIETVTKSKFYQTMSNLLSLTDYYKHNYMTIITRYGFQLTCYFFKHKIYD